jgi:hypothetical protein
MLQLGVLLLATAAHIGARPDACQVLTKKEISAVQGEAYSEVKLTPRDGGSQCFYQLPTFTKSVSVDVIRGGTFERPEDAVRVRGVGDEAFWEGNKVAGSLYVRKGDAVLRVSVGGPGTEAEKLAKSKRLALKALRRL